MNESIESLEILTEQFVEQLDELTFEQVEQFIEKRQQLLDTIRSNEVSDEDRTRYGKRVQAILLHDPLIYRRMNDLRQELKDKMNKVTAGIKQKQVYEPAYVVDSMFFDKRK